MLKENWRLISRLERVGDALIIGCSFYLAYYAREVLKILNVKFGWQLPINSGILAPLPEHLVVFLLSLIVLLLSLEWAGAYSRMRLATTWQLFQQVVAAGLVSVMSVGALLFGLKVDVSRSFLVSFVALSVVMIAIQRVVVLWLLRFYRRQGKNFRQVIISGNGRQAQKMLQAILHRKELGLRVRAIVKLNATDGQWREEFRELLTRHHITDNWRFLTGVDALERALKAYAIDEVIFTDVTDGIREVEEAVSLCAEQGVRTTLAADLFSFGMVHSEVSYFEGMPLIHFQTPPGDRWQLAAKRIIDAFCSAVGLVVLSPLMALIALAIKLDSVGPVLFRQRRVGYHGRVFWMYKFRSMVAGADRLQHELAQHNQMEGPAFKLKHDPRITRVGRFLRKYSLDELPQLWNVLRGEMSLVGPRPPVPDEVSVYERRYRRRLSMRPGLTCTWQVSGRNEITNFETWVKLDLEYIDTWSLWGDLKILLKTIPAVLTGVGAR